jgi:hypothetical protein
MRAFAAADARTAFLDAPGSDPGSVDAHPACYWCVRLACWPETWSLAQPWA